MKKTKIWNPKTVSVIFALALPTILEQLMGTLVQYIDTAMVGVLGTQATAAVGGTATVSWLMGMVVSAFGVGFMALISQSYGSGNIEKAQHAAAQSEILVMVLGIIMTIIPLSIAHQVPRWMQMDPDIQAIAGDYFFVFYTSMLFRSATIIFGTVLRAARDTRTPMLVGILVNIVNVILNFLLIYPTRTIALFGLEMPMIGAGMGVVGAALASALSFVVGGVLLWMAMMQHKDISPKGHSIKPDKAILLPCLRVAFPNMLQRFATGFGYVFFASMINSLGEISAAAHTVANTVESAFYIPGYGMMTAAATLTGNALGSGDEEGRKELSRMIMILEIIMMTVSGGLLFAFAPSLASIFSKDPEVIGLASIVLRMVALSEPFYGVSIVIEGMLQGAGETKVPFIFSAAAMWIFRIGGTFLFVTILHGTLIHAWGSMIANNVSLFVAFLLYYLIGFKPQKMKEI